MRIKLTKRNPAEISEKVFKLPSEVKKLKFRNLNKQLKQTWNYILAYQLLLKTQ